MSVVLRSRLITLVPFIFGKPFTATTTTSAILANIDTISLVGIAHLCHSLCILQGLPEFRIKAYIRFTPAQLRLPYNQ